MRLLKSRIFDRITSLIPANRFAVNSSRGAPTTILTRCDGCGRPVKSNLVLVTQRFLNTRGPELAFTTKRLTPGARRRQCSEKIAELSKTGKTLEALRTFLDSINTYFPSQEATYQLAHALYRENNLIGLKLVHDTLTLHYRHKPPSNRQARSMVYLSSMLIQLIIRQTKPHYDMKSITSICSTMAKLHCPATVVLYNIFLKLLFDKGEEQHARAMFEDLIKHKTQPNRQTYGVILDYYARRKRLGDMLHWLQDMEQRQIQPDAAIVTILVLGYCRSGLFDMAEKFVQDVYERCNGYPKIMDFKRKRQMLDYIAHGRRIVEKRKKRLKRWKRNSLLRTRQANQSKKFATTTRKSPQTRLKKQSIKLAKNVKRLGANKKRKTS